MTVRCALLLTATVEPGNTPLLELRDPEEREAQYLDALANWCETLPASWAVVVAENSGWPSSRFAEVGERAGRTIQFLACEDRGSEAGKGVGEAGLIDDFVASPVAGECDWVFKCTGRLHVRNFDRCMPTLAGVGVCGSLVPTLAHMDSRFFGASIDVFRERFTGMGAEIREAEGLYMEHVAARRLLATIAAGHAFLPFPRLPQVVGRSASLDRAYDGPATFVKTHLRERVRQVVLKREILI